MRATDKIRTALNDIKRYEPTASFSMTVDNANTTPHIRCVPGMRDTGNAVHAGWGPYVKYSDILRIVFENQSDSE